ncbi:hypothetical protein [Allosphingosinicella indica]|uniref:hypothetical protein n=1 Tax=Allosphingosinicella indica TaxID=941907 RepID=UPI0012F51BF6|nr:hypothetical protein [Allosphingosinicella indica]
MAESERDWPGPLAAYLDALTAFDAMRKFLENWWVRSGSPDQSVFEGGDVAWLLSACDRTAAGDGAPADLAMWEDWQQAVTEVRRTR